jgi:hypothetical protein
MISLSVSRKVFISHSFFFKKFIYFLKFFLLFICSHLFLKWSCIGWIILVWHFSVSILNLSPNSLLFCKFSTEKIAFNLTESLLYVTSHFCLFFKFLALVFHNLILIFVGVYLFSFWLLCLSVLFLVFPECLC